MSLKNIDKSKIYYVVVIILLLIIIFLLNRANNNEQYIRRGDKELYDIAIDYLKKEDNSESNGAYYKTFYSYDKLGLTKNEKYKYAYMWILGETYHLENGEPKERSAYSMFFKFTFKDNKVVKYENPEDGGKYIKSVKKMCLDNLMSNKVLKYNSKLSNEKQVKAFYDKVTNPKKLTKKDIINEDKLLFTISNKNNKCVPVSLNVYENKYELYTKYKGCKKNKNCNTKLEYTSKKTGKHSYDVIKIIKNSENSDLLKSKERENLDYIIYVGKKEIVHTLLTDNNNKYLNEFLKNTKVDLDACANAE